MEIRELLKDSEIIYKDLLNGKVDIKSYKNGTVLNSEIELVLTDENITFNSISHRLVSAGAYNKYALSSNAVNKGITRVTGRFIAVSNVTLSNSITIDFSYNYTFDKVGSNNIHTIIGTPVISKVGTGAGTATITNNNVATEPDFTVANLFAGSKNYVLTYRSETVQTTA